VAKRSLSSQKRVRQNLRRRNRNKSRISALKTQVRCFTDAVAAGNVAQASTQFVRASALLDRAGHTGLIHRNTASRRKARLARRLSRLKAGAKG